MSPKKSTRTHLHVTESHEIDDTSQPAATTAERTTATVSPYAECVDHNDLNNDLWDQIKEDSPISNNIGDFCSHIPLNNHVDVANLNWLMVEIVFINQVQWKTE